MNAPAPNLPSVAERKSVLLTMAHRYNMEPSSFEQTLRATVVPPNTSKEQFAAFLVVAHEYSLNPLTKEIYAFPARGGGIVPIVSVDGWCHLINSHPQCNGIEFDDHVQGDKVPAITCRIWRKDREKPTVVTEYLAECHRITDPWKQYPRRMLRHKALIQCARYAFGFAGIVDPDEAERIGVGAPPTREVVSKASDGPPPPPPRPVIAKPAPKPEPAIDVDTGEILDVIEAGRSEPGEIVWEDEPQAATADDIFDGANWLKQLEHAYACCGDVEDVGNVTDQILKPRYANAFPPDRTRAVELRREHLARVQAAP